MLNQSKVREGLDRTGRQLITDLQAAMVSSGANATGKTAASLAYTINFSGTGVQFLLTGGAGWAFVEQGRGKTVNKSGTGEVRKAIEEWAQARGIPAKRVPGIVALIHRYGTRLHRKGLRRDVYTSILTAKRLEDIAGNIGLVAESSLASEIVQAFKTT